MSDRTQVGIIGAGPAGLVLAHRLAAAGISSVILESRERAYVEARVRAGVVEQPTVELLDAMGLAARLKREGLVHHGVNLQWDGVRHRIDFAGLVGGYVTVYGQQELVKDLVAAHLAAGGDLRFECEVVGVERIAGPLGMGPVDVGGSRPRLRYRHAGGEELLTCDVVAGCDGFHGVSRAAVPAGSLRIYDRSYPYAWLGILAAVPPSTDELIYSYHERGFALHSLRSPTLSRLYLQVDPAERIAGWPDGRIWSELQIRLASPGWTLAEGPVVEKGITPMRSFVAEPMRYGRLFLAGDSAHIVPPTGAKGMNLAIADVKILADALVGWYSTGDHGDLDGYSDRCLERVWRVQDFSATMTSLLHVDPTDDAFGRRVARARRAFVASSRAMATSLAENYVGFPLP